MRVIKDYRRAHFAQSAKTEQAYADRVRHLKALLEAGENIVFPERIAAAILADAQ